MQVRWVRPAGEHGVLLPGPADGGVGPVAGKHQHAIVQGQEPVRDAADHLAEGHRAPRVARPARKEGVTGDEAVAHQETDAPGRVAWRVQHPDGRGANGEHVFVPEVEVRGPREPRLVIGVDCHGDVHDALQVSVPLGCGPGASG